MRAGPIGPECIIAVRLLDDIPLAAGQLGVHLVHLQAGAGVGLPVHGKAQVDRLHNGQQDCKGAVISSTAG